MNKGINIREKGGKKTLFYSSFRSIVFINEQF